MHVQGTSGCLKRRCIPGHSLCMSLDQQRQSNLQELPGTHRGRGRQPAHICVRLVSWKSFIVPLRVLEASREACSIILLRHGSCKTRGRGMHILMPVSLNPMQVQMTSRTEDYKLAWSILPRSQLLMCLAASMRTPLTPRDLRSFKYVPILFCRAIMGVRWRIAYAILRSQLELLPHEVTVPFTSHYSSCSSWIVLQHPELYALFAQPKLAYTLRALKTKGLNKRL